MKTIKLTLLGLIILLLITSLTYSSPTLPPSRPTPIYRARPNVVIHKDPTPAPAEPSVEANNPETPTPVPQDFSREVIENVN